MLSCLCIGLVLLAFVVIFLHAHGFLVGQMIGMLTRIMMTSAIYNKASCICGDSGYLLKIDVIKVV